MTDETKCPQCGAALPAGGVAGLCPSCLLQQGAAEDTGPSLAFTPPSLDELARLFPQLEILELIGTGGMGAVYKARQKELDRLVALKILPPGIGDRPGFAERFTREAKALAKLNHPGIVTIHDTGRTDGLYYLLMEFVDGVNLRQLLKAGRIAPREALAIVPQICDALQYAHDVGIVHRDIKPENILLDRQGRVKVADFGLAKLVGTNETDVTGATGTASDVTEAGHVMGTPQYMAPEQRERPTEVDHRADIYSLGVVFYQMLTGDLPGKKLEPPSRKVVIDVRLDEVVLRALEKQPGLRYQQVSDVKTMVQTIVMTPSPHEVEPVSPADAEAYSQAILSRDCPLNIGSCLQRGWKLVTNDFWRVVGVTMLINLLVSAAGGALVGNYVWNTEVDSPVFWLNFLQALPGIVVIVVAGPLWGGLWLYYLKRVRGERVTVGTAFTGFQVAFKPLFLTNLVRWLLTMLGLVCGILPGIYLGVAWTFAIPLAADRRLNFSPAMKLSRRVIAKHWWKYLGFLIVLGLLNIVGLLCCYVGSFVTVAVSLAAMAYAYEDIFGSTPATSGIGQKTEKAEARSHNPDVS